MRFDRQTCTRCPVEAKCTTAWQAKYARRAGAESTIAQSVKVTDTRQARYRSLPKTRLERRVPVPGAAFSYETAADASDASLSDGVSVG